MGSSGHLGPDPWQVAVAGAQRTTEEAWARILKMAMGRKVGM